MITLLTLSVVKQLALRLRARRPAVLRIRFAPGTHADKPATYPNRRGELLDRSWYVELTAEDRLQSIRCGLRFVFAP